MTYAPSVEVGMKALIPAEDREDWAYLFLCRAVAFRAGEGIRWDVPGGRVGESFGDASFHDGLDREVDEEVGLQLTLDKVNFPVLLRRQIIPRLPEKVDVVRFTSLARATGDVVLSSEHTDFQYATRAEALELNIDEQLREMISDDSLFSFEQVLPSTAPLADVRQAMLR